jgi:hypothetical protein
MAKPPEKLEELASQVKHLSDLLSAEQSSALPPSRMKRVRETIADACKQLQNVIADLDPIKHPGFVFDPSNPNVVGRIVAITMIAQTRKPLASLQRFYGSGVYAIYYNGEFPAYAGISKREHPIYVGKADPSDPASKTAIEQGDRLANRLSEHSKNIAKATSTLRLEDFEYRALVVQTGWQNPAEDYLIHLFKPIWNSEVNISYGFGKHGDDPGTRANLRSPWDTIHPGRDWAHRDPHMQDARPKQRILEDIHKHLEMYPPMAPVDEILRKFLEEIRAVS